MISLVCIINRSVTSTIRVTTIVFSIIHVEYRAVALGLYCGSRLSSVRINTRITFVVWCPPHQYPVTLTAASWEQEAK